MDYVLGFCLSHDRKSVLLIHKASGLQGIGGKIHDGETPTEAMIREFKEETDLHVDLWQQVAILRGVGDNPFVVHLFRTFQFEPFDNVLYSFSTAEGMVSSYDIDSVMIMRSKADTNNFYWILLSCLDEDPSRLWMEVEYV